MAKNRKIIMKIINKNPPYCMSSHDIFDIAFKRVNGEVNGSTVFIPHVCNNIDLFGAGFAQQIAERFPSVKQDYHMLGKNFLKNNMGYAQIIKVYEEKKYKHKLFIVNMIAQNGIRSQSNLRPLNYWGLVKSMTSLASYITTNTGFINKNENVEIHCPKFGSGLAGGDWHFISDLIEDIWSKFFVTVYKYDGK
jgi:hypothetical protein